MKSTHGKLIVISGPSGCGKTTICEQILKHPRFQMSVSATTRKPRAGEKEGVDYHFISREEFIRKIKEGAFLEYAEYCGNLYGTLRETVENALRKGYFLLLEIDVQGALQLMDAYPPGAKNTDCLYIFIKPPSCDVLKQRLRGRATEDENSVRKRLEIAQTEMKYSHRYDLSVVNEDINTAVEEIMDFIAQRTCNPEVKI